MLDIFAVLGNIAQIKNAAAGFLQQIERNIYDMLGFSGFHPSGAVFVEIARHQFERRAGFAGEQHGSVLLGRALERAVELLNGGAVAQFVEREAGCGLHFAVFEGAVYGGEQLLQRNRLFEKIERADFGGFNGGVDAGMPAHHHHGHIELAVFRPFFEQGDAVAIGHPNIEQHHGRPGLVPQLAGFFCVFGQGYGVAFVLQDFRQEIPDTDFIVYN